MKKLCFLTFALALSACAPHVMHGNDVGGVVQFRTSDLGEALKAADAHCQKFGKKARITSSPSLRTQATFECV